MPPSPPPCSKIYLITHEFYPQRGGIATFTEEMARACSTLGHQVEVWAQNAPASAIKPWPFDLRRLPVKGTHNLSCQIGLACQLVRQRRLLRHATVYLPEPGPMLGLMLLQGWRTFRPRNLVLTFHGSEIIKFYRNPFTRRLARALIRRANRISVLSRFSRKLLCDRFPEATAKVFLTPGALRADFAPSAPRPAPTGQPSPTIILTVGRLHPRKGQWQTLQALQGLPPALRRQVEYWLVGVGNRPAYEGKLRQAAAAADFPVRFLGDLPDDALPQVYDRADIFAMTSIDHGPSVEGFGLVYLEAAGHGLPVVAHDVGGVGEAVRDGETGLLVSPRQPDQLTAAFAKLIDDPLLRHALGEAGRRLVQRHDWTHSAQILFPAAAAQPA